MEKPESIPGLESLSLSDQKDEVKSPNLLKPFLNPPNSPRVGTPKEIVQASDYIFVLIDLCGTRKGYAVKSPAAENLLIQRALKKVTVKDLIANQITLDAEVAVEGEDSTVYVAVLPLPAEDAVVYVQDLRLRYDPIPFIVEKVNSFVAAAESNEMIAERLKGYMAEMEVWLKRRRKEHIATLTAYVPDGGRDWRFYSGQFIVPSDLRADVEHLTNVFKSTVAKKWRMYDPLPSLDTNLIGVTFVVLDMLLRTQQFRKVYMLLRDILACPDTVYIIHMIGRLEATVMPFAPRETLGVFSSIYNTYHYRGMKEELHYVGLQKELLKDCISLLIAEEFRVVNKIIGADFPPEMRLTADHEFVFDLYEMFTPESKLLIPFHILNHPNYAVTYLMNYAGDWILNFDWKKCHLTGSAMAACIFNIPPNRLPPVNGIKMKFTETMFKRNGIYSQGAGTYMDSFYPAIYTIPVGERLIVSSDKQNEFLTKNFPIAIFREVKGKQMMLLHVIPRRKLKKMVNTGEIADELKTYYYDVLPGADIDIAVDVEEDNEFDKQARAIFDAVKSTAAYLNAKMVRTDKEPYGYRIYMPDIESRAKVRDIEIFRSTLARIASHHVSPVRASYTSSLNQDNIPQFVLMASCLLTGMSAKNQGFHYFASRKQTPMEIALKYRMRGFKFDGDTVDITDKYMEMLGIQFPHLDEDIIELTGMPFCNLSRLTDFAVYLKDFPYDVYQKAKKMLEKLE